MKCNPDRIDELPDLVEPGGYESERPPSREDADLRVRQLMLPAASQAAGFGRRFTRQALADWGIGQLEENSALLVSELVGNAIRHAQQDGSALELRLEADCVWLRIEVVDPDPRPPQPRTPGITDESGFGFVLVDALADKWGVRQTPRGKVVWVELAVDP